MKLHLVFLVDLENEAKFTKEELRSDLLKNILKAWSEGHNIELKCTEMLDEYLVEMIDALPPGQEIQEARKLMELCVASLLAARLQKTNPRPKP